MSESNGESTPKSIEEWKAELATLRASLDAFSSDIEAFGHTRPESVAEARDAVHRAETRSETGADTVSGAEVDTDTGLDTEIDIDTEIDAAVSTVSPGGAAEMSGDAVPETIDLTSAGRHTSVVERKDLQPSLAHASAMSGDGPPEDQRSGVAVPRSIDLRLDGALSVPAGEGGQTPDDHVHVSSGPVSTAPGGISRVVADRAVGTNHVPEDDDSSGADHWDEVDDWAQTQSVPDDLPAAQRAQVSIDGLPDGGELNPVGSAHGMVPVGHGTGPADDHTGSADDHTDHIDEHIDSAGSDAGHDAVGVGSTVGASPARRGFIGEIRSTIGEIDASRRRRIAALLVASWLVLIVVNMTAIRSKVEHSLENSSRQVLAINGQPGIKADASGLTVTLTGYVGTEEDRTTAAQLVKARFGVRQVVNRLIVDPTRATAANVDAGDEQAVGAETGDPAADGGSPDAAAVSATPTTLPLRGPTIDVAFKAAPDGSVATVDVHGNVPDTAAKEALFARLSSTVPVERISSNVQIPTPPTERADMTSYRRLGSFLQIVAKTKSPNLMVTYESGNLALSGSVADVNDLALIRAEARNLVGTGSVADTLTVAEVEGADQPDGAVPTPTTTIVGGISTAARPVEIAGVGRTDTPAAKAAQISVDGVITGKVIAFEKNRARLTTSGRSVLNALADVLLASTDTTVRYEISGHTDDKGSESSNLDLSTRRAEAVRDALIAKGVPADRLVAKGYGESQPVATNDTETGRSQNRRIEVRAAS